MLRCGSIFVRKNQLAPHQTYDRLLFYFVSYHPSISRLWIVDHRKYPGSTLTFL
nr:MAG TPA: putative AtpZ [Bacteriophage sp.]